MGVPDETERRLASERVRDDLNRQIKDPFPNQKSKQRVTPGKTDEGAGLSSHYRDPSTMDGKLRWD